MAKIMNDSIKNEMIQLKSDLKFYVPEYEIELSIKVKDSELMYAITVFPIENATLEDVFEVFGRDDVDLRLQFFILISTLRKQVIDKLSKKA